MRAVFLCNMLSAIVSGIKVLYLFMTSPLKERVSPGYGSGSSEELIFGFTMLSIPLSSTNSPE